MFEIFADSACTTYPVGGRSYSALWVRCNVGLSEVGEEYSYVGGVDEIEFLGVRLEAGPITTVAVNDQSWTGELDRAATAGTVVEVESLTGPQVFDRESPTRFGPI